MRLCTGSMSQPLQLATFGKIGRQDDVPSKPQAFKQADEDIAPVVLPSIKTDAGGPGEGMMIVVPSFAHRGDRCPWHVMRLHARAVDKPRLGAGSVCEVADEPVAGNRNGYTNADAPDYPAPPTNRIQHERNRQLLYHPAPFEEAVEPVAADIAEIELGWMI